MRIAVFDTETTGLPYHPSVSLDKQPRIIEFAARIITESGPTNETLYFICNPFRELEPIITKITGLNQEDVNSEPPIGEFMDDIQAFFNGADGLVAHNLPFDTTLLWLEVLRAGREEEWQWPCIHVCSAQTYLPYFGSRPKLIKLYEHFTGKKYAQTHRALDDVDALCEAIHQSGLLHEIKSISATKNQNRVYLSKDIRAD